MTTTIDNKTVVTIISVAIILFGAVAVNNYQSQPGGNKLEELEARLRLLELMANWTTEAGYGRYPYNYMVFEYDSTYYARNGSTGIIDFSGVSDLTVTQSCNDALASGGIIVLKDLQLPSGLNIGSQVVIESYYQNTIKYYTNSSSGKVGNSPVCTNGTFTLQDNTDEQVMISITPSGITDLYNFYFDVTALTQNATIKVYSKIDGSAWTLMGDMSKTALSTDAGLVLKPLWINMAFNITIQSAVAEGATRSIPYRYFSEVW